MLTLTRQQVRELDRRAIEEFGVPGVVLMENAGRGVADTLAGLGARGPVAVCCGKGNNGGDGFVIARHLDLRGIEVRLLVWANRDEITGDAATNLHIVEKSALPLTFFAGDDAAQVDRQLDSMEWIVDALLGTGATGEPRPPLDAVIDRLNAHSARKLAVDVPSGLDCDTGQAARHTIRASHTCTFVAAKPGFFAPGAERYTGQLHVLDIGAPRRLVEELLSGS
jgi:NAD(P)H-hydrate epimerase